MSEVSLGFVLALVIVCAPIVHSGFFGVQTPAMINQANEQCVSHRGVSLYYTDNTVKCNDGVEIEYPRKESNQ